jgi:hypothetical protein
MWSYNFWRLMFNKVTSRSYIYFLKFSYFFWSRNGFLQVGQKVQKLVRKIEGILGVKLSKNEKVSIFLQWLGLEVLCGLRQCNPTHVTTQLSEN